MTQLEIRKMLEEAASPACTAKRKKEICEGLRAAANRASSSQELIVRNVLADAVARLFTQICEDRRDQLPTQFPFFALVCGDPKPGDKFARIDWSVLPSLFEPSAAVIAGRSTVGSGWQGGIKETI